MSEQLIATLLLIRVAVCNDSPMLVPDEEHPT
jgi:hypothetical protein